MTVKLCRLCAKEAIHSTNIYEEEGKNMKLASKIIKCLQILVSPSDQLPKAVCDKCLTQLNQCFEFVETSSRAQESLVQLFTCKPSTEIDIKEEITSYVEENISQFIKENGFTLRTCHSSVFKSSAVSKNNQGIKDEVKISKPQDNLKEEINCVAKVKKKKGKKLAAVKFKIVKTNEIHNSQDKIDDEERKEEEVEDNVSEIKENRRVAPLIIKPVKSSEEVDPLAKNELEGYENNCSGIGMETRRFFEEYQWHCVECSSIFDNVAQLKSHYESAHCRSPLYKCLQCTKVYDRYRSFARHLKQHKFPKKFRCDICEKCFSQKTVLQSHKAVHTNERPHVCVNCGKSFKQFSSLYLHSKCHQPDKPNYFCDVCQKNFATKHTLETHRKIHTGERDYICDVCGKSFIAKGSLDYHMLTHSSNKPHDCETCGKGFKTRRLLMKHSTLHTGVKPHQCDVCGKQFREKGALREHNRIHTGVMPYSCEHCGKRFRFKGILTVHIRQHTGERPYSCTDCKRTFTNWANYNKHMKRRHKEKDASGIDSIAVTKEQAGKDSKEEIKVSPTSSPGIQELQLPETTVVDPLAFDNNSYSPRNQEETVPKMMMGGLFHHYHSEGQDFPERFAMQQNTNPLYHVTPYVPMGYFINPDVGIEMFHQMGQ